MKTILLTCGETSGEHHAALVVSGLKRMDPSCRVLALGGCELREAGAEVVFPMEKFAFMGFSEIVSGLPRVLALERELRSMLRSGKIDLFMPVDYPGLNLRLSRYARRTGVPVLYFISPQIWAWGGWRIRKMRRSIDLMATILPFEAEIYENAGIPVVFVGHPMLDEIDAPRSPKCAPAAGDEFNVLLFPGSRRQEVERMLPPLLGAARLLKRKFPGVSFRLGLAPLIDRDSIEIPSDLMPSVGITRSGIEELGQTALVLAASGTVTLQSAISGTPMVVFYRTSALTYFIGKLLVRIPWIAMPNVLAGGKIVPELVQRDAVPEKIADEAMELLTDGKLYETVSGDLLGLRKKLEGQGGASSVARMALEMAR